MIYVYIYIFFIINKEIILNNQNNNLKNKLNL